MEFFYELANVSPESTARRYGFAEAGTLHGIPIFSANAHFWRYVLLEGGPSTGSRVLAPEAQRAVSVSLMQELSTGCSFFRLTPILLGAIL